ncbi:hypothetical protein Q4595_10440 [Wenyingzhuangia sp. 1_MG-2023]|nr:hypothetical protein [Wenyingzhuangia sp. 1_MG-2023]
MLKKTFIFILLTALSVRPAYYVGMVVYYETHINEIVEKYCVNKDKPQLQCNGQCHLAKQLNTTTNSQNTNKDAVTLEASCAFYPVYFQEILQTTITFVSTETITSYFNYEFAYRYLMSKNIHKPPMV